MWKIVQILFYSKTDYSNFVWVSITIQFSFSCSTCVRWCSRLNSSAAEISDWIGRREWNVLARIPAPTVRLALRVLWLPNLMARRSSIRIVSFSSPSLRISFGVTAITARGTYFWRDRCGISRILTGLSSCAVPCEYSIWLMCFYYPLTIDTHSASIGVDRHFLER